jgi:arylsulfatase A-like enzyme
VSVGQKLIAGGVKGGYTDAAGTPNATMLAEIEYVDAAIGQMVTALASADLLNSTTIIITAKHGQSPVDTNRFFPIPGPSGTNGIKPSKVLGPAYLPDSEINQIGATEDDGSLLWLTPGADTVSAVNLLEAEGGNAGIGQIFYGSSIATTYDAPGLPPSGDPRTPDIIVQPNVGVIYTGSTKKQAEHGGFAQDDTHVMLLVSNPHIKARTVTSFVETTQVAPTVLSILGLDPNALTAVRAEGTPVLPGFGQGQN